MTVSPYFSLQTLEPGDGKLLAETENKGQKRLKTASDSSIYKLNVRIISLTLSFLDTKEMCKARGISKLFLSAIPNAMDMLLSSQEKPTKENIWLNMILHNRLLAQVMQKFKNFKTINCRDSSNISYKLDKLFRSKDIKCTAEKMLSFLLKYADGPLDLDPVSDNLITNNLEHLSKIRSLTLDGTFWQQFTGKSLLILSKTDECMNLKR